MALSGELSEFCRNWRAKADLYSPENLRDAFDRFFTLYVVFNRLYAEAAFRLARRDARKLTQFRDSNASQDGVLQFCTARVLTDAWESNSNTKEALQQIVEHLRDGRFALKLDMVTGDPNPDADRALLAALESRGRTQRAKAGLAALYAVRCNMFHGHKGFDPIQLDLLRLALLVLESTIDVLHRALERDSG